MGAAARGDVGDIDEATAVPPEINLIGMRVKPALEELEGYIDRALLASRKEVRVVHGRGTGVLRKAVRDELARHPLVERTEPDAEDGATLAHLGA